MGKAWAVRAQMTWRVLHGDCCATLPTLDADGFHACVTDPPYHLSNNSASNRSPLPGQYTPIGKPKEPKGGFMGKKWDGGDVVFRPETWAAVLRVLKPGAHLLAFGGTRTYHRLACAIENAGFEIRDAIMWHYGSGFPKSHDVSKAIDWAAGARGGDGIGYTDANGEWRVTGPATDASRQWQGWGTALKPATEIIVVARKPLAGRTVAANVLAHGCGAINIDGCRLEGPMDGRWGASNKTVSGDRMFNSSPEMRDYRSAPHPLGRWPANLIHDGSDEVLAGFPQTSSGMLEQHHNRTGKSQIGTFDIRDRTGESIQTFGDAGSAARFFYTAKADKQDRLDSKHPTVKPVDLMRYLVRLVTPPHGHVLDPFAGSGTTLMACMAEGFDCTLIEREEEYVADIHKRIAHVSGGDAPLFAKAAT